MSLTVRSSGRGRSKSPGRRDPSPPRRRSPSSSDSETDSDDSYYERKTKTKKYYDDDKEERDYKKKESYKSTKDDYKSSKDDYKTTKHRSSVSETYSRRDRSVSSDRSRRDEDRDRDYRRRASSPGLYSKKDKYDRDDKYKRDDSRSRKKRSPSPKRRSPSPKRRSPSRKKRSPSPRRRSPSPKRRSPSPKRRSPSPRHGSRSEKYVYERESGTLIGGGKTELKYEHDERISSRDDRKGTQMVELRPGGSISSSSLAPSSTTESSRRRLSVGGHSLMVVSSHTNTAPSLALAPGSPFLESYQGTYQSLSPMPSPIALPPSLEMDIDRFRLDASDDSDSSDGSMDSAKRRRARHRTRRGYDIVPDTKDLVEAINAKSVKTAILIDILPRLSHEQILAVRVEYKKRCKISGQGINIAKHIKSKMTGSIGKAAYVTALGQWESEAYWASFWYNPNNSRRELLIEALMGRTNSDIKQIKKAFKDKRYNDDLEKCMKAELKADKFRVAVLLVLEEKRQEESRTVSTQSVTQDVRYLHEAMQKEKGGETLMIQICVTRSDIQLRAILDEYERTYRKNFAKEMLKRSTNLVGEVLAHILNGVINKPVRDALLLHHAIKEYTAAGAKNRDELLISRLVRYHWDRPHFERIKFEFKRKYGRDAYLEVAACTKGEYRDFMVQMAQ